MTLSRRAYPVLALLLVQPQMAWAHEPGKSLDTSFLLPLFGALFTVYLMIFPTFGTRSRGDGLLNIFLIAVLLLNLGVTALLFAAAAQEYRSMLPEPALTGDRP